MINKFEIFIESLPDRNDVVASVFFEKIQFAEISQEAKDVRIEFYPHTSGKPWNFKFDEMIEILTKAKAHLTQKK